MKTELLVPLPVFLPLGTAALLAGLRKWLPRTVQDTLSIVIAAVQCGVTALLLHASLSRTIVYWFGGWTPRGTMAIGINFVVDPAGALLATFAAALALLAFVFSWKFPDSGGGHLHPLLFIFLAAVSGFVLTGDLFNLFVWFELMSTAAFALCGLDSKEQAPMQSAFNFAVTNTVAAFLVLTGIALLYAMTGALNLAQIGAALGGRHDATVLFAFALIVCGFLTKAAIVPFHFWLPDAHAVAPTAVCVLFSGLMVELGLYAIARLTSVVFAAALLPHEAAVRAMLLGLGVLTVLLGGVMCYAEHHLKRVLAFSTVCHAGLMLMMVAIGTPTAYAALLVYIVAHGLVKGALFFCAGNLLHRCRSMSELLLWGRGRGMTGLAVLWFAGALGLAGFPLFATAAGEAMAGDAAHALRLGFVPWAFVLGGALTAAAPLRFGMHTFFGWGTRPIADSGSTVDERPEDEGDSGPVPTMWLPPAVALLAAMLFLPVAWHRTFATAAQALHDTAWYLRLTYGAPPMMQVVPELHAMDKDAVLHGILAAVLGLLLACTSVFRLKLPRMLRLGAQMEGPLQPLRALQSGTFTDYVLWMMVGVCAVGGFCMVVLR